MKKCRKITDLISKQQDQVRLSLFNRIALAVTCRSAPVAANIRNSSN